MQRSILFPLLKLPNRSLLHTIHTPTSNTILRNASPIISRTFSSTPHCSDFHFDTHHFVQRLEREGLNRAQAEGIMTAMAEVIDESVRNMTSNMVTKADQEKVSMLPRSAALLPCMRSNACTASLYAASRLCSAKVRAAADGAERSRDGESGERPAGQ